MYICMYICVIYIATVLSYCNNFYVISNLTLSDCDFINNAVKTALNWSTPTKTDLNQSCSSLHFHQRNFVAHLELLWMPTGVCRGKLYRPPNYQRSSWTSGRPQQSKESTRLGTTRSPNRQGKRVTPPGVYVCVHVKMF